MSTYNIPRAYSAPFSYQVTLDGGTYTAQIYWLYYGQRSYLQLTDSYGNIIVNIPLISSSTTEGVKPINLVAGYFQTSVMYYYAQNELLVVLP